MDEHFWFLAESDDAPSESPTLPSTTFDDFWPLQEPMRGERTHTRRPSADEKRVKRKIHRSGVDEASTKIATILNTQVERLNKGDLIRSPTGQTMEVHKVRPHETDSTKIYLDTDAGTSVVDRGTDFSVTPYNAQQQELPDTGNPINEGNVGQLPGQHLGPGGPTSGGIGAMPKTCPNCGNSGTFSMHQGMGVCSVCGFSVSLKGSPGGLSFTDQPRGHMPGRRAPGEVPQAHVWASKYTSTEGQMARRIRQVLGGEQ